MTAHILVVVTVASSVYGAHTGQAARTDEVRWSWPLVSTYSYMRGDYAYLEEDLDAHSFFVAMKAQRPDIVIEQRERHADKRSRVRNYDYYRPEAPK